jgi:hypothetical protein
MVMYQNRVRGKYKLGFAFFGLGKWDLLHWDWNLTIGIEMNNFESGNGRMGLLLATIAPFKLSLSHSKNIVFNIFLVNLEIILFWVKLIFLVKFPGYFIVSLPTLVWLINVARNLVKFPGYFIVSLPTIVWLINATWNLVIFDKQTWNPTYIREVKIPRFRCTCTGSIILVSNIFVDVCTFTRN